MDQKFSIPTDATPRQILQAIDEWAKHASNTNCEDLWAVLTALRGPDSENFGLKSSHTCPIRIATLPNLTANAGADVYTYDSYYENLARISRDGGGEPSTYHFKNHSRMAAEMILSSESPLEVK